MLGIAFLLAVVAASDIQDGMPPVHTGARALTAELASSICQYGEGDDVWSCDRSALAHFDIRATQEITGDTDGLLATFEPRLGGPYCVQAIVVRLVHPSADVVVDWSRVAYVVDGIAVQAVPGFARNATANLQQRQSVAPAGSMLEESVYTITRDCLNNDENTPSFEVNGDSLSLVLPFSVGGEPRQVSYTRRRAWVSKTEAEAFALVPRPVPVDRPQKPRRDDLSPPSFFPTAGLVGCGAGTVTAVGAGVANGYFGSNNGDPLVRGITCGVCVSPIALVLLGGGGLAVDLLLLTTAEHRHARAEMEARRIDEEWDAYDASERMLAAYDRKRQQLGLGGTAR